MRISRALRAAATVTAAAIVAAAVLPAAVLPVAMIPVASAAPSDPGSAMKVTGFTYMRFSEPVTRQLLSSGISVIAQDPGGGAMISPGKVAIELPVVTAVVSQAGDHLIHDGALIFSRSHGSGYHTVVLSRLSLSLPKDAIFASVFLGKATATESGKGRVYKTMKVFTIEQTAPSGPCSFSYTVKVAKNFAAVAGDALGTFFAPGARLGSAYTECTP